MSLFAMNIRSLRKQLRQSRFFSRLYYAFGLDALPVLLQFHLTEEVRILL